MQSNKRWFTLKILYYHLQGTQNWHFVFLWIHLQQPQIFYFTCFMRVKEVDNILSSQNSMFDGYPFHQSVQVHYDSEEMSANVLLTHRYKLAPLDSCLIPVDSWWFFLLVSCDWFWSVHVLKLTNIPNIIFFVSCNSIWK